MVTAMLMQERTIGMTVVVLAATINLAGPLLCRGMLVGGPQVETAAGVSEQGTARVDANKRGHVAGAARVATSRPDMAGRRSAEDEEGPSRPEPD